MSKDETDLRVLSNATNGMVTLKYLMADIPFPGKDSHDIYIGAPSSSSGTLSGSGILQNCNNSQITINLSPAASWQRTSWSVESGLSIVNQSANSITVKATSSTSTGTKFVKANMAWTSSVGGSCGASTITKSITLTGYPSSNNIQIGASGEGGVYDAICSNGGNIHASYSGGSMDSWEWDLPSGWTTNVTGNHVSVSSAGVSSNVRVRGYNECGWTGWKTQYIPVEDCSVGGPLFLSPNPALNEVTLEEKPNGDGTLKAKNENEYEIKFYESTKMRTRRTKVKVGDKIDISRLTNGTYIVHIIDPDGTPIKTRLIVDK